MFIYTIAFAFIVLVQVNGEPYLSDTTVVVPFAQQHTFNCPGTADSWYYIAVNTTNEQQISANETFIIDTSTNTLTINKTNTNQLNADYVCKTSAGKYLFKLIPQPYMDNLEKSTLIVTEGGVALAICKLMVGFSRNESIVWSWFIGNKPIPTNDTRFSVINSDDRSESKLKIKSVKGADEGAYQCLATNPAIDINLTKIANSYNHTVTVKVKKTSAALWPFLALVVEVIIVCVLIFIIEKKCSRTSSKDTKANESE